MKNKDTQKLIKLLKAAHANETGAAAAYKGHWKAVTDPLERAMLKRIEEDEREHRRIVESMLRELGVEPNPIRTAFLHIVGTIIALYCHLADHLTPMLGACLMERPNVVEYELAAEAAIAAGHEEFVEELLTLAEIEWDHWAWLRDRVYEHRFGHVLMPLAPLKPREAIRRDFYATTGLTP